MNHPTETIEALCPLHDRVVVRPAEPDEMTRGGIALPKGHKETTLKGTVLAVGPGLLLEDGARAPMQLKVGDTVLYDRRSGVDVEFESEDLRILQESEVMATVAGE